MKCNHMQKKKIENRNKNKDCTYQKYINVCVCMNGTVIKETFLITLTDNCQYICGNCRIKRWSVCSHLAREVSR